MKKTASTMLVILGGTGDLSRKKLFPALFDLSVRGFLPEEFEIVGFSRRDYSDEEYRQFVEKNSLEDNETLKTCDAKEAALRDFCGRISYIKGNFNERQSFFTLKDYLKEKEESSSGEITVLFYLAVSTSHYDTIFTALSETGLVKKDTQKEERNTGDRRILIEKPFGRDLATARELDKKLAALFDEHQIFRIDHYLAKEAIQNIITFRFSNILFERSWNKDHIEKVSIFFHEDFGVEDRGAFYDSIGALRDVGQSHVLQMLALVAMDNPGELTASHLQRARAKVLENLLVYRSPAEMKENVVRGQYAGYRDVDNVASDSMTETYFAIKAFVNNDRWRGVPFYLESGKNLDEKCVEISITFRSATPCVCGKEEEHSHNNILRMKIQPEHGIDIMLWTKKPGVEFRLEKQTLGFTYQKNDPATRIPDAYEKVLYDCIYGDRTLFVSTEEVEAAWGFVTPIIEGWESVPLQIYDSGSSAPAQGLR